MHTNLFIYTFIYTGVKKKKFTDTDTCFCKKNIPYNISLFFASMDGRMALRV